MKLWLIRHPKPGVPEGTCYGRTDVPTDDAHFAEVVARLRADHGSPQGPTPLRVVSSPLSRCARVGHALAGDPWPTIEIEPLLAEMHFGDWEGRPWTSLPRAEINAWRDDIANYRPPGGETVTELADRGWRFLQAIAPGGPLADPSRPAVAVLTHSGVIMTLLKRVQGESLAGFGRMKIDFGSVHALSWREGRWQLEVV